MIDRCGVAVQSTAGAAVVGGRGQPAFIFSSRLTFFTRRFSKGPEKGSLGRNLGRRRPPGCLSLELAYAGRSQQDARCESAKFDRAGEEFDVVAKF